MELRGCFSVSDNEGGRQLKWVPDGKGGGQFTGFAAFLANTRLEILSKITTNISYVEEEKLGTRVNATHFDGCLGRLQSGTSDFYPVDNLIFAPNIEIGATISSQSMGFFSTYNPVCLSEQQELMHTVHNISPFVWIVVFAMIAFTSAAMTLGIISIRSIHKGPVRIDLKFVLNLVWKSTVFTFRHFFKLLIKQSADDAYGLKRIFFKFMILMIILLGFYVSFYATAIIKTDAVTLKRPATIESYDEIISSGIRPVFQVNYRDHISFENAESGSKKNIIWKKAVKMAKETSKVQTIDWNDFTTGQVVIFASQPREPPQMILMHHCHVFRLMRSPLRPIFVFDKSEPEFLSSLVHSGHLDRSLSKALYKTYVRFFEAQLSEIDIINMDKALESSPEDKVCTENRVVIPDAGFSPIQFSQIRLLSIALGATLSAALFLLMGEILIHRYMSKRRKRRVRPSARSVVVRANHPIRTLRPYSV